MCGITGLFSVKQAISGHDIRRMTDALKHRGPDDEGYVLYSPQDRRCTHLYGDDSVEKSGQHISVVKPQIDVMFLGHRRLSIIDLSSAGHQPMTYDGKLVIVFNGEIYNYLEIKHELEAKGYVFNTATDTEVILASYLEWQEDCLSKFDGMWSFVILDIENNILFGARDRFGVKPFYYYNKSGCFAFASEVKSLITMPFINRQANDAILYDYLRWGMIEHSHETFFVDIFKLPPSHHFRFNLNTGELKIRRYYHLKYNRSLGFFDQKEFGRHCEKIRELIFEDINYRLRSDVPIGTCLSGGLDSSSVVVIINELLKSKHLDQVGEFQKVFTACYKDNPIDESEYAQAVVEQTRTHWFKVYPSSNDLMRDLDRLVYFQDEPFNSTSIYAQYRVMQLAAQAGVKVILDGQGGDEIFTGYTPYYAAFFMELLRRGRWKEFQVEVQNLQNSPTNLAEICKMAIKFLGGKFLPPMVIATMKKIVNSNNRYINNDFLQEHRSRDKIAKEMTSFSINETSDKLINHTLLPTLLKYEDRNSMAHSIEARTPFSDYLPLIEYLLSIPSIYKIHHGWSKYLLRNSLSYLLPDKITNRKDKIGFAIPQKDWLMEQKATVKELFQQSQSDEHIYTNKIANDLDILLSDSSGEDSTYLWRFINLIKWKNQFINN